MLNPVILMGTHIRLEPLAMAHADDLARTTGDPATWLYHGIGDLTERADLEAYIASVQDEPSHGTGLNFAVVMNTADRAIGATSLWDISLAHRRAEIGRTWLPPNARRTGANTEAKFLLLRHAFESLGMLRVQLKTDTRNTASRHAIERLGATYEGVLRSHMILHNGLVRDTAYYSVIADEWSAVKEHLQELMTPRL